MAALYTDLMPLSPVLVKAMEDLETREKEVNASITELQTALQDATRILKQIRHELTALRSVGEAPLHSSTSKGKSGKRPWAKHPPRPTSYTGQILNLIPINEEISVATIITKSELQPQKVRGIMANLCERELITRVSEGHYIRNNV